MTLTIDYSKLKQVEENRYECPSCKQLLHKFGVSKHIKSIHPELISQIYKTKSKKIKGKYKKYVIDDENCKCPYCDLILLHKDTINHIYTHSNEEQFKIDFPDYKKRTIKNKSYKLCENCTEKITSSNYTKHLKKCLEGKIHRHINTFDLNEDKDGKLMCPECGKKVARLGMGGHYWRMHTKDGQSKSSWCKGMTKEESSSLRSMSNKKIEQFQLKPQKFPIPKNISDNELKGIFKNVKYYKYTLKNGEIISLRGKLELQFAEFLDKNDIEWEYEKPIKYWDEQNKKYRFIYPDFYLIKINKYFDAKGVLSQDNLDRYNIAQIQNNIDINFMFDRNVKDIINQKINLENYKLFPIDCQDYVKNGIKD